MNYDTSDTTNVKAYRAVGGNIDIPTLYAPSYKAVEQILFETNYNGAIDFHTAALKSSQAVASKNLEVYAKTELNNASLIAEKKMLESAKNWRGDPANESGSGYMSFVTEEHDKITDEVSSGISSHVKPYFKEMMAKSKAAWANSSFRDENIMTSDYMKRTAVTQLEGLANLVITNPDNIESYREEFKSVMSSAKTMLPAAEYAQVERETTVAFNKAHALGLIRKNPNTAVELIRSPEFARSVPTNVYTSLLHTAESVVKTQDSRTERELDILAVKKKEHQAITLANAELAIIQGKIGEAEINSLDVSDLAKIKLKKKLFSSLKSAKKEDATISEMLDRVDLSLPMYGYDKSKQNKLFDQIVRTASEEAREPIGIYDQAVKAVSFKFTQPLSKLSGAIQTSLENEQDPSKVYKAAEAVNLLRSSNPAALGNISDRHLAAASMIVNETAHDMSNLPAVIIKTRESVLRYRSDEEEKDMLRRFSTDAIKDKVVEKVAKEMTERKAKNLFIKFDSDVEGLEADAYNFVKEAYLVGAEKDAAVRIATEKMKSIYSDTMINGESQLMKHAPEKMYNVSSDVIKNFAAKEIESVAKHIDKNSDTYPGLRIRPAGAALKTYDKKHMLTSNVTTNDVPQIEVLVGDKWEKRSVYVESSLFVKGQYGAYFLLDPNDPLTRQRIYDTRGTRTVPFSVKFNELQNVKLKIEQATVKKVLPVQKEKGV
ncbi:MAG: hypothetical protein AB7U45_03865 [Desulfamplus sp.]